MNILMNGLRVFDQRETPPFSIILRFLTTTQKSSNLASLMRHAREVFRLPDIPVILPSLDDEILAELEDQLDQVYVGEPKSESNVLLKTLTCGICFESFCAPSLISSSAPSTSTSPANAYLDSNLGVLQLPCPSSHSYCIECLRGYLRASLDHVYEVGRKQGPTTSVRCPECPFSPLSSRGRQDLESENEELHPGWGFDDNLVGMILCGEDLHRWRIKRILESIPHMRCSNTKCGELIEIPRNNEGLRHQQTVGNCPMCHISMCISCKSVSHPGETCETYQRRLASDMEDETVLSLARSQGWRRCSNCAALIEHFGGCRHMRCRCGWEFCFKCGSGWDRVKGRCGAPIPCGLYPPGA